MLIDWKARQIAHACRQTRTSKRFYVRMPKGVGTKTTRRKNRGLTYGDALLNKLQTFHRRQKGKHNPRRVEPADRPMVERVEIHYDYPYAGAILAVERILARQGIDPARQSKDTIRAVALKLAYPHYTH